MWGRYYWLAALIVLIVPGCSDMHYADPVDGQTQYHNYTTIEDGNTNIAQSQEGFLYLANTPPKAYSLDSGDKLRIDVFGQENLSRIYSVDGGGYISMPLIGTIRARGITTYALERNIAAQLSQDYLKDPKVTVEINTYRPFFILGEVRTAGKFPYENRMTVQTAVAIAGGFSPRASESYAIVTRTIDGREVTLEVPFNFPVLPGDTVRIAERFL